jgi:hypothetical protein
MQEAAAVDQKIRRQATARGGKPKAILKTGFGAGFDGTEFSDTLGQLFGKIDHLLETGSNDVMVVKPCAGSLDDRERLLPYTEQCVLAVDLVAGEMKVDWDADF